MDHHRLGGAGSGADLERVRHPGAVIARGRTLPVCGGGAAAALGADGGRALPAQPALCDLLRRCAVLRGGTLLRPHEQGAARGRRRELLQRGGRDHQRLPAVGAVDGGVGRAGTAGSRQCLGGTVGAATGALAAVGALRHHADRDRLPQRAGRAALAGAAAVRAGGGEGVPL